MTLCIPVSQQKQQQLQKEKIYIHTIYLIKKKKQKEKKNYKMQDNFTKKKIWDFLQYFEEHSKINKQRTIYENKWFAAF